MKRLFVAASLAVAAVSLPATAALADGYAPRHAAKPKPQLKRKAPLKKPHHARKHHRHYEGVRDFGALYKQRSYASYSLEQYESVETSYYEESAHHRVGPVVHYRETYINPARGCYPEAPCGYETGVPMAFHYGGHPGGVGYGVDGGAYGQAYGYYGGYGYGHSGAAYPPVYGHPGYPMPRGDAPRHWRGKPHGMKHHFQKPGR
jgi:hypothetical protein